MATKKIILLAGIICLLTSVSNAQVRSSFDVQDSSLIPAKRMPQHSEFLNGTYNFPAKPRNQWEIGLKAGMFAISGDVPAVVPTPGCLRRSLCDWQLRPTMKPEGLELKSSLISFNYCLILKHDPLGTIICFKMSISGSALLIPMYKCINPRFPTFFFQHSIYISGAVFFEDAVLSPFFGNQPIETDKKHQYVFHQIFLKTSTLKMVLYPGCAPIPKHPEVAATQVCTDSMRIYSHPWFL